MELEIQAAAECGNTLSWSVIEGAEDVEAEKKLRIQEHQSTVGINSS